MGLADALQGFGAGVQGQGQQFLQGRQQQQEREETKTKQLSQERRQAMLIDNRIALDHITKGNFQGAEGLLKNRLDALSKIPDADPTETLGAYNIIRSKNPEDIKRLTGIMSDLDQRAVLEGFLPEMAQPAAPERVKGTEINGGYVVEKMPDGSFRKTKVLEEAGTKSGMASAVTKIYSDATTVQALPGGTVNVTDPEGNLVTGAERLEVLRQARENDISLEQAKSGAKEAGSQAITMAGKAFERIEAIKSSMDNVDEAIRLIKEDGANTGVIMSKIPSITSASVQLDNLQKRMGLDIIKETAFGALSDAELKFALDSALPLKLSGDALIDWLERKKSAQTKLSSYLQDVAIYMGTPGNTAAGWLEAQRALNSNAKPKEEAGKPVNTVNWSDL